MAKEVVNKIKLQIRAGQATPAPPVGTILGPVGINLGDFCTKFNDVTKDKMGDVLPVEISIYEDRSFDFVIKTPPAAFLLLRAAKIKKGSARGAKDTVGKVSKDQIREIAETKMPDLNAYDIEEAMRIIEGTAHNMGIILEGEEEVHEEIIEEEEFIEEEVNNEQAEVEVINQKGNTEEETEEQK